MLEKIFVQSKNYIELQIRTINKVVKISKTNKTKTSCFQELFILLQTKFKAGYIEVTRQVVLGSSVDLSVSK